MGRASRFERHVPQRLAEKLLRIRLSLGLSQNELLQTIDPPEKMQQCNISGYERGTREPTLLIVLKYARLVGVSTDVLIDDDLDLPEIISIAQSDRKKKLK